MTAFGDQNLRINHGKRERRCSRCRTWKPATRLYYGSYDNGKQRNTCRQCNYKKNEEAKEKRLIRITGELCHNCNAWKETGFCPGQCPDEKTWDRQVPHLIASPPVETDQ